jgi:2-phospho-L-lactate guanylyltransferase (CobY/MobA/RfbA family)
MAYNKKNLLVKIIEIQDIVLRERKKGGISQVYIYNTYVKNQYYISSSTFNNYLARNAKKEMEILNKKDASNTQLDMFEGSDNK